MKFKIGDKVVVNEKGLHCDFLFGVSTPSGILTITNSDDGYDWELKDLDNKTHYYDDNMLDPYTPDYAKTDIVADIKRMEMKHGKEVVAKALEEYLKESGASER